MYMASNGNLMVAARIDETDESSIFTMAVKHRGVSMEAFICQVKGRLTEADLWKGL